MKKLIFSPRTKICLQMYWPAPVFLLKMDTKYDSPAFQIRISGRSHFLHLKNRTIFFTFSSRITVPIGNIHSIIQITFFMKLLNRYRNNKIIKMIWFWSHLFCFPVEQKVNAWNGPEIQALNVNVSSQIYPHSPSVVSTSTTPET